MGEPARTIYEDFDQEDRLNKKGYKREPITSSGQFESFAVQVPETIGVPKFTFVGDNKCLRAKKPVTIHISKGEELWFAESDKLNIYATGKDSVTAIQDFVTQLIYFYNRYKSSSDDQLLEYARELKAFFLDNFIEEY